MDAKLIHWVIGEWKNPQNINLLNTQETSTTYEALGLQIVEGCNNIVKCHYEFFFQLRVSQGI